MIIRAVDCPSQPWKNGLGRTREIAVQRRSPDSDGFVWRVSVAEVDSAVPFSRFPGVDRLIVLLEGNGFTMTLDDGEQQALTTPFVPFAFAGEAKVDVTLVGGPTRDFNLMVCRERARGELLAWRGPGTCQPDPAVVLVFCARGTIATAEGLMHGGEAWRPPGHAATVTLHDDAVALAVRVEPRCA